MQNKKKVWVHDTSCSGSQMNPSMGKLTTYMINLPIIMHL